MFSQLGPLFKTTFRKAEQSDARFEIRREEKDNQKKEEDEKEDRMEDSDLWADSTSVSIQALRNFLVDFLKSKGDDVPEENSTLFFKEAILPAPDASSPDTLLTQKAHKAYATIFAYGQNVHTPSQNSSDGTDKTNLSDLLAVDELRTIHILIKELDILFAKGVHTLTIEKDESFLKALVVAVQKEKGHV